MNAVRHVRIFKNGRSRAVRIPKDWDLFGDELVMGEIAFGVARQPSRALERQTAKILRDIQILDLNAAAASALRIDQG